MTMQPESRAPSLANMSAPPRSTVTLPRLTPGGSATSARGCGSAMGDDASLGAAREIPVGPGGGKLLSNALCVARVELPTAVCAYLRMGFASQLLTAPLGLARALVAIARQASPPHGTQAPNRAARRELERVIPLPEGALVQELAARLESIEWPDWVPRAAFAIPLGNDIAAGIARKKPPEAPRGVGCPLLAARMVSAIRGPVFLRDAAPALSNLLDLWGGATPSGTWDIWLPIRPGQAKPVPAATSSTTEESS
jgi:hypothetical protein